MTTSNKPLGLSLPITLGSGGYFDQNYDTFSQIKTNIVNLLRTIPGERRMQPTFGCRVHSLVFDPNEDTLPEIIENIIREDVNNWVSGVGVRDVSVQVVKSDKSNDDVDIYKLNIQVQFQVFLTGQTDAVEVSIEKGLI